MGQTIAVPARNASAAATVLGAISVCHLLNDMLQSLLPAVYPILKGGFHLNFAQIGALTLTYQITASLLQPVIGSYTDRRPQPYSLPIGMGLTLLGLLTLAVAPSYATLLAGAALLGMGSSIFHPESSRIARLASGGQHGLAQSVFQVGGNFGQALGPLLAAFVILPHGRGSIAWFAFAALFGIALLSAIGHWYQANGHATRKPRQAASHPTLPRVKIYAALSVLVALIFSKFFYLASFTSYYIFYLMQRFHLDVQTAQVDLFIFMAASAVGTVAGGPIGDRIGRKRVIWCSIAGVVPFTLALPYAGLEATIGLSVIIGLVLSSAFSAIVVYAQELLPGRVGMVSGLFFGLAFGMGGIGAAVLGVLADHAGIEYVYRLCAFLPLIGLLAAFLPQFAEDGTKSV
jgi:FSR family fosmidomycin resistance protein-like MFS transporter